MTRSISQTVPSTPTRIGRPLVALSGTLVVAGILLGCNKDVTDKDIRYVSIAEVRQWQREAEGSSPDRVALIDPRGPRLYNAGHITGAVNVQLQDVPANGARDPSIDSKQSIVVYGEDPGSAVAKAMAKRLMAAGYGRKKVRWFAGGLDEWRRNGLPITRITIDEQRGATDPDTTAEPAPEINPAPEVESSADE